MKRLLALALLVVSLPLAAAAEKWYDAYNRGVAAVNAKNYDAAADAFQHAIAEMPNESGSVRAKNELITYVPHFWLGIAKFNKGDLDGALREWKTSEDQGVVQSTPYYSQLREWVARAQSQKQRNSETAAVSAAAESKNAANGAVTAAVVAQTRAVAAGADRSDAYRTAQRKLQEAMDLFKTGGTDIAKYRRAQDSATQAKELFTGAAEAAKRERESRPVQVAKKEPPPAPQPKPQPQPVVVPFEEKPAPVPAPVPQPVVVPQPAPAPAAPVESEALVAARIAVQQYRRRLIDTHAPAAAMREAQSLEKRLGGTPNDAAIRSVTDRIATLEATLGAAAKTTVTALADPSLENAWRAYAAGDLDRAEALLTSIVSSKQSAEALLLRGCTRYTRAMLSTKADLAPADADFRAALAMRKTLRLDEKAFSPKLVAYFEGMR